MAELRILNQYRLKECYPKGLALLFFILYHLFFGLQSRIPLCCIFYFIKSFCFDHGHPALDAGCAGRRGCEHAHCKKCQVVFHDELNPKPLFLALAELREL